MNLAPLECGDRSPHSKRVCRPRGGDATQRRQPAGNPTASQTLQLTLGQRVWPNKYC